MKIEIIVEKAKTGYSAYAEKYPVYTVGKSLEELKTNILEDVNFCPSSTQTNRILKGVQQVCGELAGIQFFL
jgi:hypothetical protein